MEDYKMLVNFVSCLVLTGAFTAFLIFVFGRQNSKVYSLPFPQSLLPKIGLGFCTAGALLNALTLSNPQWSEVSLNFGLAVLFTWAAYFHWKHFVVAHKTKKAKKTKYK